VSGALRFVSVQTGTAVAVADVANVMKARSMLMILPATCQEASLALPAAEFDRDLIDDLHKMVNQTSIELATLKQTFDGRGSSR
jgi:molybdenum cofactor biosynthesis enzyme